MNYVLKLAARGAAVMLATAMLTRGVMAGAESPDACLHHQHQTQTVPEIDASAAIGALTLLTTGLVSLADRRRGLDG